MSRAPTEHDSPSMFAGLQEAPLSPFFKAIANTLGEGTPKKACGMFVEKVKREYLHTTLGAFFDLEMSQVEALLEETPGASKAWIGSIEKFAGMKFQRCANRVGHGATGSAIVPALSLGEGARHQTCENTLYKQLGKSYVDQIFVPNQVFSVVTVFEGRALGPASISALANACALWVFCLWGKFNVGIEFVRSIAPQFYRLVGETVNFEKTLSRKFSLLGRTDAKVRHSPTLPVNPGYIHTACM